MYQNVSKRGILYKTRHIALYSINKNKIKIKNLIVIAACADFRKQTYRMFVDGRMIQERRGF